MYDGLVVDHEIFERNEGKFDWRCASPYLASSQRKRRTFSSSLLFFSVPRYQQQSLLRCSPEPRPPEPVPSLLADRKDLGRAASTYLHRCISVPKVSTSLGFACSEGGWVKVLTVTLLNLL